MICFDLDGTLLDTILDMADSMNRVLRKHGLKENSVNDYISYIGSGAYVLTKRSVHERIDLLDTIYEEYQKDYKNNQTNLTNPFVSIETLKELKKRHKLSVISNKPDSDVKRIVNHYFKDIFDYVSGNIEGIPHKPDKAPLDLMIEKLNLREEITYVGDSLVDFEFAKNANIRFIGVSYGYGDFKGKNITLINNIKELL